MAVKTKDVIVYYVYSMPENIVCKSGDGTAIYFKGHTLDDLFEYFQNGVIDIFKSNDDLVFRVYDHYITIQDYIKQNGKNSFKYIKLEDEYGRPVLLDIIDFGLLTLQNGDYVKQVGNKITGTVFGDIIDKNSEVINLVINANKGPDQIVSGSGNDSINGGPGDDVISGGHGNDTIVGGTGTNTVIFDFSNGGKDTIKLTKGETLVLGFTDKTHTTSNGINIPLKYSRFGNNLVISNRINDDNTLAIANYFTNHQANVVIRTYNTEMTGYDDTELTDVLNNIKFKYFKNNLNKTGSITTTASSDIIDVNDAPAFNAQNKGATINAGNGNNEVTGSAYNDVIKTGKDNDTIFSGTGDDVINAGDGADSINGGEGNDKLTGGKGKDTFVFSFGNGVDTITDADYTDKIEITGKKANNITDICTDDLRFAKNKNDLEIFYSDEFDENNKIVVKNYYSKKDIQRINTLIVNGDNSKNIATLLNGNNSLTGKGTITGTKKGNDNIIGSSSNDTVKVTAGENTVEARGGDDKLYGGTTTESNTTFVFNVGDGADTVYFGKGEDTLQFKNIDTSKLAIEQGTKTNNKDLIIKYSDNDMVTVKNYYTVDRQGNITGVNPKNSVKHFVVNDRNLIFGTLNNETLVGTNGTDNIYGKGGNDYINGGNGNDYIWGGSDNDTIIGSLDNDFLDGDLGNDTYVFSAGDGHDTIAPVRIDSDRDVIEFTQEQVLTYYKTAGYDLIIKYNNEQDSITLLNYFNGELYPKTIFNGTAVLDVDEELNSNPVIIEGTVNAENIYGSQLNDIIYGYDEDDSIEGGLGDDTIIGGTGNDTMSVYNKDTFIFNIGDGNDVIDSGSFSINKKEAVLKFNNTDVSDLTYEKSGNDIVIKYSDNDSVTLKNYILYVSNGQDTPLSQESAYTYTVIDKNNSVNLLSDIIKLKINSSEITSEIEGENEIIYGCLYGTIYPDLIIGNNNNNLIQGGLANDTIYGGEGIDHIDGDDGDDILYSGAGEIKYLSGGNGNDTIYGEGNNNYLNGGKGNDTYINSDLTGLCTINDESGTNDSVRITGVNKNNLVLRFDLNVDNDGNIIENNSENMYITLTSDFGNTTKGIKVFEQFVEEHCIESVTTADNFTLTKAGINQLRENIASWLHTNHFASVQQILNSNNPTDIGNLIAQFQTANWQ